MYFLYFQHTISSQSEHSFCSKLIINSSAPSWCNHTKNYVLELFLFQWKNYWLAPMSQSLCPITRATKTGLQVPDHTRSSWWSHERDKWVPSHMGDGAPTNITGACIAKPVSYLIIFISFYSLLKEFTYLFLERRGEQEKERERNKTSLSCLPQAPRWGTEPAPQACALTGNGTRDLSPRRTASNPLRHFSQGISDHF